jgi:hypothetical protein
LHVCLAQLVEDLGCTLTGWDVLQLLSLLFRIFLLSSSFLTAQNSLDRVFHKDRSWSRRVSASTCSACLYTPTSTHVCLPLSYRPGSLRFSAPIILLSCWTVFPNRRTLCEKTAPFCRFCSGTPATSSSTGTTMDERCAYRSANSSSLRISVGHSPPESYSCLHLLVYCRLLLPSVINLIRGESCKG